MSLHTCPLSSMDSLGPTPRPRLMANPTWPCLHPLTCHSVDFVTPSPLSGHLVDDQGCVTIGHTSQTVTPAAAAALPVNEFVICGNDFCH